jgi:CheY-like chemotaxis protein
LATAPEHPAESIDRNHPDGGDGLRILVVDDNRDAAATLAMVLEELGAVVSVAHDGDAALAAYGQGKPDVVLLDIGMPVMDGYDVARRLREQDGDHRAVLVALTGWGQEGDRRRAREAGFDHHLVKPAKLPALRALLRQVDRRRGIPA